MVLTKDGSGCTNDRTVLAYRTMRGLQDGPDYRNKCDADSEQQDYDSIRRLLVAAVLIYNWRTDKLPRNAYCKVKPGLDMDISGPYLIITDWFLNSGAKSGVNYMRNVTVYNRLFFDYHGRDTSGMYVWMYVKCSGGILIDREHTETIVRIKTKGVLFTINAPTYRIIQE